MKVDLGSFLRSPDLPAYAMSMATHLLAVLLGGALGSLFQGEAWPMAARELRAPNLVIALPGSMVDSAGFQPGDRVHLSVGDADDVGGCLISRESWQVLAEGDVVLLAQDLDHVAAGSISALRKFVGGAAESFASSLASSRARLVASGKVGARNCAVELSGDVVVDRRMRLSPLKHAR